MSSLGDAFRTIALQHLAAGGSAEDLHDGLHGVLGAAPEPSTFSNAAKQAGQFVLGPPIDRSKLDRQLNSFENKLANFGGGDVPMPSIPTVASSMPPVQQQLPPNAPPLPGQPGALPIGPPGGGGGGSVSMPIGGDNPYVGTMNSALAAAKQHGDFAQLAADQFGQGTDLEAQGKAQELALRGQQTEAETPIREEEAKAAADHAQRVADIEQAGQQKIQAQMGRYQSASDAAAQTEVHNFFDDKTTGASIMAIISQALSGAANGLAGNPGAPTPLDRVIQQDIERQKINLEQKNRSADRQGNMLGVLRDELKSDTLAEAAMYDASITKAEAMVKQLAPYYAGGISSAQAQQALGALQEKKAANQGAIQQHLAALSSQQADTFGHVAEGYDNRMLSLAIQKSGQAAKDGGQLFHRGFSGSVPHEAEQSAQKLSQGYYGMQSALANISDALNKGMSLDQYNALIASDPILSDAVHKLGFTRPNQLEDLKSKLAPSFTSGNFNALDQKKRLHDVQKFFANQYREQSLGLNPYSKNNPNGLVPDYGDSVMGPLWNELDSDRATARMAQ